jgi:hypothetical protein
MKATCFGMIRCVVQELLELFRLLKLLFPTHKESSNSYKNSNSRYVTLVSLLCRIVVWGLIFLLLYFILWWMVKWIQKKIQSMIQSVVSIPVQSESLPLDSAQGIFQHFLHLFLTRHPASVAYHPSSPPSSSSSPSSSRPSQRSDNGGYEGQEGREGRDNNREENHGISSTNQQRPKCSKGEKVCKEFVEEYFGKPFEKVRPDFLQNPVTKENLELDCYNEELKLAIEYNGRQHYEYTPFMHSTKETFYAQQYRDLIKQELCKKNGINLITVPYKIPENAIPDYIKSEISKLELGGLDS